MRRRRRRCTKEEKEEEEEAERGKKMKRRRGAGIWWALAIRASGIRTNEGETLDQLANIPQNWCASYVTQ